MNSVSIISDAALRHTVLVVDDKASVRVGLQRLLEASSDRNIKVLLAHDAASAVGLARTHRPALTLLDVDLGDENGLDLLPQLRRYSAVLVLTSHADEATRAAALALGAVELLAKQMAGTKLLARVASHLPPDLKGEKTPTLQGAIPQRLVQ